MHAAACSIDCLARVARPIQVLLFEPQRNCTVLGMFSAHILHLCKLCNDCHPPSLSFLRTSCISLLAGWPFLTHLSVHTRVPVSCPWCPVLFLGFCGLVTRFEWPPLLPLAQCRYPCNALFCTFFFVQNCPKRELANYLECHSYLSSITLLSTNHQLMQLSTHKKSESFRGLRCPTLTTSVTTPRYLLCPIIQNVGNCDCRPVPPKCRTFP
jgi:hypothetical protein